MRFTRWQASSLALALGAGLLAGATPAAAQDTDARLKKVEAEVRALQRQVFPGGDGKFFAPEVVTPGATPGAQAQPVGTPADTAMTDVLNRLTAIESQLAQLTARSEVTEHAQSTLEERVGALEKANAPPVAPVETAPDNSTQPTGVIPVPSSDPPAGLTKAPAKTTPGSASKPAGKPSAARLAKVQAVAKPDTGNPGDDEYSYGFRLWDAGLYPEAAQQLKLYVDKYPKDPKISYGRNLLGRAYLDDNQPAAAASYFLQNYQSDPNGARAPDSLLFLADAMMALKDNTKACRALAEFSDKYPTLAMGRLRDQYDKDRKQAGCK